MSTIIPTTTATRTGLDWGLSDLRFRPRGGAWGEYDPESPSYQEAELAVTVQCRVQGVAVPTAAHLRLVLTDRPGLLPLSDSVGVFLDPTNLGLSRHVTDSSLYTAESEWSSWINI